MNATKPETEPPHASNWREVRDTCDRQECGYPFCACPHVAQMERELAALESEAA